jgi:Tfp pilus assembly PilM family ATPase
MFNIFPKKQVGGIDLTHKGIYFSNIENKKGAYKVRDHGFIAIKNGAINDGVIRDSDYIISILKKIRRYIGKVPVVVAVPDGIGSIYRFTIPFTPKQQLFQTIHEELRRQQLMDATDEELLDFSLHEKVEDGYVVNALVMDKKEVALFRQVFKKARFKKVYFDVRTLAIPYSLTHEDEDMILVHKNDQQYHVLSNKGKKVENASSSHDVLEVNRYIKYHRVRWAEMKKDSLGQVHLNGVQHEVLMYENPDIDDVSASDVWRFIENPNREIPRHLSHGYAVALGLSIKGLLKKLY